MNRAAAWGPAAILGAGAMLCLGASAQRPAPLRAPLDSVIPMEVGGFRGQRVSLSPDEAATAGMTAYVSRVYRQPGGAGRQWWSLYIGYYGNQTQGKTIHSPKNCLPGGGWEPLQSTTAQIVVGDRKYTVNRYLLRQGSHEALVLYWYQGRGRVAWNEYQVKWHLLRDAALHHRTEEALVRILVPVSGNQEEALALALGAAGSIQPSLDAALPSRP